MICSTGMKYSDTTCLPNKSSNLTLLYKKHPKSFMSNSWGALNQKGLFRYGLTTNL